ncbi:hypothetical protein [Acidipila sp. EB88]|uniref:hypothetical protein n=1 Tax=Acidipila sp. EB88 TaxID=2305226 RepID=UPI000F5D5ECA|nr:hypothetical protein [Acidipila sp. EB88]RRA47944.1 hypothetical protein D1Y84_06215 [Acidipila sp. EB88]
MRKGLLCSVLVPFSFTAFAQQQPAIVLTIPPASMSCPVGFAIAADSQAAVHTVAGADRDQRHTLLKLSLQQFEPLKVIGATVAVHGGSGENHVLRTAEGGDKVQILHLHEAGNAGWKDQEIQLQAIRFPHWAEITEINYADGTNWRPTGQATCRADINGFHLIGQ